MPRPESLCDGDVEASYETNANSKGSGDKKNTDELIGNSKVKKKSERRNTRKTESKNEQENCDQVCRYP